MISKLIAAIAACCAALTFATAEPVMADGMPTVRAASKAKVAKRYRAVRYTYVRGPWPGGPDPYAYSYHPAKYYPYYNSRYWVPRKQMLGRSKYPFRIPEYYSSWGYPLDCKLQRRRHCGVPYIPPAGDPGHYYRRDVQLPTWHHAHHRHYRHHRRHRHHH